MDLSMLCRLCAKEDRLCIKVFGEEGVKQSVAKKIRLCLPIIVKETDDFPKQICLNCLSNLDTSYELYTRCLEAQSVIKNMMMVNVQSNGEMVKVYSTQEMLKMVNELREKMSEKRPAMRLGNTIYTIRETGNQTDVTSNGEQRAKKRKAEDAMKGGSRGVIYPVGPLGQQYMLMPSTGMPPAVVIPSGVPHGQFAIAPMPGISTFPIQPAPPQTVVSTAPAVQTSTDLQTQTAKVTKAGVVPSPKDMVHQTVQPAKVQPKVAAVNNSETPPQPQITSIQPAIQAFQSSTTRITSVPPIIQTINSTTPLIAQLPFALSNTTGNIPNPSVTESQRVPLQGAVQISEIVSLQTSTPVVNKPEESPSEILPLISSDTATPVITKRSPRSSPTNLEEPSAQKSQSPSFMVNVNTGDDNDDDDDDYAADDPDPLHNDSEEEAQDTSENNTTIEKPAAETAAEEPDKNRDDAVAEVEELSSDTSNSGAQVNSHKCPYCNKYFPDDVIFHHKKLHFRQKFFSCISCNKNFRTEAGLENHRCD